MKIIWTLVIAVGISFIAVFFISFPSFAQSAVCAPGQFESDIAVSTSPGDNILKWSPNAHWSYDYANKREFSSRTDPQGNETSVVLDFQKGLQYVWTTSAQGAVTGCQAKYLSGTMPQFCGMPDGSGQYQLAGSLQVSRWTATFPSWQFMGGILGVNLPGSIAVEGVSSVAGFLPVSMTEVTPGRSTAGLLEGPKIFFQALFPNVTLGIRNPAVFNAPASCQ